MKKNREKFLTINNLLCVVMLIVMIGTLLLPCWDYTKNVKTKDHTCEVCGYYVRAEKLESSFRCPDCGAKKREFESVTVRLQFEENASVLDYTWMTFNHPDLTEHFNNYDLQINQLVLAPFLVTLLSLFGIAFCALKRTKAWPSLFALASGVIMLLGLLMVPAYHLSAYWIYMVIAAAGLTLVALVEFIQFVIGIYKWCVVPVKR